MSKAIPTSKYHWFEDDQVFILWNWVWSEDNDEDNESRDGSDGTSGEQCTDVGNEDDDDNECDDDNEGNGDEEEDSETMDDGIPAITHCVIFKCIGYTKEHRYQEVLIDTSEKHRKGESVPVKLEREPDNPYDCNAIAFMCKLNDKWERIGYVVTEALSDVSTAIRNKKSSKFISNGSSRSCSDNLDGMQELQ